MKFKLKGAEDLQDLKPFPFSQSAATVSGSGPPTWLLLEVLAGKESRKRGIPADLKQEATGLKRPVRGLQQDLLRSRLTRKWCSTVVSPSAPETPQTFGSGGMETLVSRPLSPVGSRRMAFVARLTHPCIHVELATSPPPLLLFSSGDVRRGGGQHSRAFSQDVQL